MEDQEQKKQQQMQLLQQQMQAKENLESEDRDIEKLMKLKENPEGKSQEELAQEKKALIEKIKELEEDYYHPKEKMPDEEVEKITEELKNHPLFMKEMPENIEGNQHLEALQQIIYDDTPENIAKYCCDKGNELFKKGQNKNIYLKESLKAYTDGIDANSTDKEQNAKLFNNRALIYMKFKSYGKAIDDVKSAIKQNPSFVKAYYRGAQAYYYLFKYRDAKEFLTKGLELEPNNKEMEKMLKETEVHLQKQVQAIQDKKDDKKQQETELFNALKLRNIYLGKAIMDFPDTCRKSCWIEDDGKLHFPTFIQYPEFQQMDYINDIPEDHIFANQIAHLLEGGLPYDSKKLYNINNVELYIELNQVLPYYDIKNIQNWPRGRGLIKIDINKKMSTLMATKGYVLPRVTEFFMVCPENKEFYAHFLKNFDFFNLSDLKPKKN